MQFPKLHTSAYSSFSESDPLNSFIITDLLTIAFLFIVYENSTKCNTCKFPYAQDFLPVDRFSAPLGYLHVLFYISHLC